MPHDLETDGFAIAAEVLPPGAHQALLHAFPQLLATGAGNRDGLLHPAVRSLAASREVRALVEPVLGATAFAHRATLFDKTPTANWLVTWHQDLVVPVQERRDAAGFGPWSQKRGVWFVQPPEHLLRNLLAVRIDLDGSDAANGALRVLPGTHCHGVLAAQRSAALARTIAPVTCHVPAGGALCMRPLLLHASSKATRPVHRRIVHIEYTGERLPGELAFRHAISG